LAHSVCHEPHGFKERLPLFRDVPSDFWGGFEFFKPRILGLVLDVVATSRLVDVTIWFTECMTHDQNCVH